MQDYTKSISYPYAYGYLDVGVATFADKFAQIARENGFEVDDELKALLDAKLRELSKDAWTKGAEEYATYG